MIAKQHKLSTKAINYLMRRKQSVYVDGYKILYCEQYPNHQYHQTGIQVSGKIHKHAVQRNIIRRAFYAARADQIDKAVHNHYHKVFVVIHPEHCEFINKVIGQR
jgi:ribonuclease P protein component